MTESASSVAFLFVVFAQDDEAKATRRVTSLRPQLRDWGHQPWAICADELASFSGC